MAYQEVTVGESAPDVVNLIIEIQKGGGKNKYEFDKNASNYEILSEIKDRHLFHGDEVKYGLWTCKLVEVNTHGNSI